jgi:hypothetical protein
LFGSDGRASRSICQVTATGYVEVMFRPPLCPVFIAEVLPGCFLSAESYCSLSLLRSASHKVPPFT